MPPIATARRVWAVLALAAAAACAVPPADAATLRIRDASATVSPGGRTVIVLSSSARRTAATGTLTLRSRGAVLSRTRFRVPPRGTRRVAVRISPAGVRRLARDGRLSATAVATAPGLASATRSVTLRAAAPSPTGPGASPGAPAVPIPAAPAWSEGRYQGRYAETNADLAFNVAGGRLFTGPFDAFYVEARCRNADPAYTGPDQAYPGPRAIEPVEATIAADGSLSGAGTVHVGSGLPPIGWSLTGQLAGGEVRGRFTASFVDGYGNPCEGATAFVARYFGSYVLGT